MNAILRPTAEEIAAIPAESGRWRVPVEMVLAAPTASLFREMVSQRIQRGDYPLPTATVVERGCRLFTVVDFAPQDQRAGVFFPLDMWVRPRV